ncbi:MAG: nucleoid-associated protein YgaU [Arenicella sp.]|jgi:nucleoid-associated protein YgaU
MFQALATKVKGELGLNGTEIQFLACSDPDCTTEIADKKWVGDYNPPELNKNESNSWKIQKATGSTAAKAVFQNQGCETLEIPLIIHDSMFDATEVAGLLAGLPSVPDDTKDVATRVDKLRGVVFEYRGEDHSPPFVKVIYGDSIFKGFCSDFKVKKTKFDFVGKLQRAEVTMTFKSSSSIALALKKANNQSPDMTHYYTVLEGETLTGISNKIYGKVSLYMELAKANQLTTLRYLEPGSKLIIPPLER